MTRKKNEEDVEKEGEVKIKEEENKREEELNDEIIMSP